jgi:hypothetical protein
MYGVINPVSRRSQPDGTTVSASVDHWPVLR